MFRKDSRDELKSFGLLLSFMLICGTIGAIFFSKIVWLLSNFSILGGLFLFVVFISVVGGVGFGLYLLIRKAIPTASSVLSHITPYAEKAFASLKKKKDAL